MSAASPHWDEQNPWKDRLVYVEVTELAACSLPTTPDRDHTTRLVDIIANWSQYGVKLDAYILVSGTLLCAGVRFGPEPDNYLSPSLSLPKLMALLGSYHPVYQRDKEPPVNQR